ncbi:hypothetical protein [Stenotrophomonas sp. 364]|uniref:hypothetical protein n=1 Tax=Stenotrophomonas sp. 364 TaxID=2691571 RepID=UPI001315C0F5|nr:hypothetical protein [Stenotrophomonas sp. 364]QHB73133.1 hypothetical protein GQ674_18360 [Stenotrophomonas sp. 364]
MKLRATESNCENKCGTLIASFFGKPSTVRLRNSEITEIFYRPSRLAERRTGNMHSAFAVKAALLQIIVRSAAPQDKK